MLLESDEKSVVKCIVISPKGKQKSLISVQHPCSIVNVWQHEYSKRDINSDYIDLKWKFDVFKNEKRKNGLE